MALIQANRVKDLLEQSQSRVQCEIVPIKTQGDLDLTSPLHSIGGKGVFVKAIETALSQGMVDIAVHSLKDMTSHSPQELCLAGFLKPEAVTDALVLAEPYTNLNSLPPGAVIATGSLRRQSILKKIAPHLKTIDIRGNVETRLQKLTEGHFSGVMLSEAGLVRLNLQHRISERFDPFVFCPAPGQGVIALQTKKGNEEIAHKCKAIGDQEQFYKSSAELAFLERVGFDCRAPLGLFATFKDAKICLYAFAANPAMDRFFEKHYVLPIGSYIESARAAADELISWMNA